MIRSLTGGLQNAAELFDGDIGTAWFPGWNPLHYPAIVVIDLQKSHNLSQIRLFDGSGKPKLRFFATHAETAPYQILAETQLDAYQQWVTIEVAASARFIKIELSDIQGDKVVGEIEFYANDTVASDVRPAAAAPPPAVIPLRPRTGTALKLGSNGFHWVPPGLLEPFAWYREYQCWDWMEAERGLNRFEPSDGASGNFDTHYRLLKSLGIQTVACINQTPDWLLTGYPKKGGRKDFKPVPFGESTLEPRAYRHFARFLFQVAARYGRAKIADKFLTINTLSRWTGDGPNRLASGLDLLEYIEVWNEPDKWWSDPETYFSPQEYAAMLSACYDGHEGKLGYGYGIKTADPTMKVVMAGLSNFNIDYLKEMKAWFSANRKDRVFPADVVNFHHYSNQNQALKPNFEVGIAPEADNLQEKLQVLVQYVRRELKGKIFWFSEFGYDTHQNSPQRAVPYSQYDAETVQAMWIVRSYLEAIAAGVDAAFVYNIIDEDNEHNGLFQSSGLAHSAKAGFGKKIAWNKVAEWSKILDGATLIANQSAGQLRMYVFEKEGKTFNIRWSLNNTISDMPQR